MKHTDGIVITRGDDSNALNNNITITLKTDMDLTGFTGIFQIGQEQWVFNDITSKVLDIIVDKATSLKFHEGTYYGALKLFEPSGLCKTVFRDIPVYVKEQVVKNPPTE
jgi:hypothetical protein